MPLPCLFPHHYPEGLRQFIEGRCEVIMHCSRCGNAKVEPEHRFEDIVRTPTPGKPCTFRRRCSACETDLEPFTIHKWTEGERIEPGKCDFLVSCTLPGCGETKIDKGRHQFEMRSREVSGRNAFTETYETTEVDELYCPGCERWMSELS